ncbi:MAG: SpoIID/LytB domain-containing protein [Actinomycetota bacterium]|nr:SpoIID/LytB domain-containing protein [Actinomycetota bacterium]
MFRIPAAALLAIASLAPAGARAAPGDPTLQRLLLTPGPHTTFKVIAEYDNTDVACEANLRKPLRARYAGRLEIVRAKDGTLALVNQLTFGDYLNGLSEVPRSWPPEALKAQVIAARSYALYHYNHRPNSPIGYDLCSTDACQVYRGLTVSQGAFGDAWQRAVRETAGQVLKYDGSVIQAFFFSTSWGRTVSNSEGFGGPPLPYLKPTTGEDDDAPLAHWRVEIPYTDLTSVLIDADLWSGGTITSASVGGGALVVSGGGARKSIGLIEFRRAMNQKADCLFPSKYPSKTADGHLPEPVPSIHFTLAQKADRVVLDGRGWGHGVGMSQYGARSLASRGRRAADIVSHFYGGLKPARIGEPGALRVLVGSDSVRIRIEADGPFSARGPSGEVRLGRSFQVRGGTTMKILRAGSIAPVLSVDPIGPEMQHALMGGRAAVRYELPTSAKVAAILWRDGAEIARAPVVSQKSGPNEAGIDLVDGSGDPLAPGLYEMTIEATDGIDTVRAVPVAVAVHAIPSPLPLPPPVARTRDVGPPAAIAGVTGLIVIGFLAIALRSRRKGSL